MIRLVAIGLAGICIVGAAFAQMQPTLGEAAKALIGTWEFSNADRDKICTATFKSDPTKVGFKVEFDKNCAALFPLVNDVAGWVFPENDLLRLLDDEGKSVVEFSEVEDGIYEAPTPGVGVLFLQNAAAAGAAPKPANQLAGEWALVRTGKRLCSLTLTMQASAEDSYAMTMKPGCDPSIARLNFTRWRIDRDELMLTPARGNPWRFEEDDNGTWHRVPESADQFTLMRQ